jgi:asparagine synthase (glutamine-hydrolysing)
MCGIFAVLNSENYDDSFLKAQFMKGKARGPESTSFQSVSLNCKFGFHRLAINGLDSESDQPIQVNDITLICNGEIYNYRDLYSRMPDVVPSTQSDCEVIIHLYKRYGIEQTLQMLDGVFAFVLSDADIADPRSKVFVARDPYGVRPLYELRTVCDYSSVTGFASEVKALHEVYMTCRSTHTLAHFPPGTYSQFSLPFVARPMWRAVFEHRRYHSFGFNTVSTPFSDVIRGIQTHLVNAVKKRALNTERPVACLLSGGLDSSLITALVNEHHKQTSQAPLLTFSIGLKGSVDLAFASTVATYLGTKHTSIELTEEDFCNAIPDVIKAIESYDTTTVRASIGNYMVAKYIANHSDAKVVFNGDGADELCGGYLYMNLAPDAIEFDRECRRLLSDVHMFDVLRSDKSISGHGLEPRTPFLDRSFVQYYLGIDPALRFPQKTRGQCEKYLLRTAFSADFFRNRDGEPLLPTSVLWRTKEAFSDGVSMISRSLFEILKEHAALQALPPMASTTHCKPDTD